MSEDDAARLMDDAVLALLDIADLRPYRYRHTSYLAARDHERQRRTFVGYSDSEIAGLESTFSVRLPTVFRA
ncbi:MAG: hypothetical protein RIK87_02535 [Fuerstiella sp.]